METPPELTGSNLFLSGAGQRVYLDNETLNDTPAPVAASTVARLAPDKPRFVSLSVPQGTLVCVWESFRLRGLRILFSL